MYSLYLLSIQNLLKYEKYLVNKETKNLNLDPDKDNNPDFDQVNKPDSIIFKIPMYIKIDIVELSKEGKLQFQTNYLQKNDSQNFNYPKSTSLSSISVAAGLDYDEEHSKYLYERIQNLEKDCFGMLNLVNVNEKYNNPLYFFMEGLNSKSVSDLIDKKQYFLAANIKHRQGPNFYCNDILRNEDLILIYDLVIRRTEKSPNIIRVMRISITVDGHSLFNRWQRVPIKKKFVNINNTYKFTEKEIFTKSFKTNINTFFIKPISNVFTEKDLNGYHILMLLKIQYYTFLVNFIKGIKEDIKNSKIETKLLEGGMSILIQLTIYNENNEIIENYWINSGDCILLSLELHRNDISSYFKINNRNLPENKFTLFSTSHNYKYSQSLKQNEILNRPHSSLEFNSKKTENENFNFPKLTSGFYKKKHSNSKVIAFVSVTKGLYNQNVSNLTYYIAFATALENIKILNEKYNTPDNINYAFFLYFFETLLFLNRLDIKWKDISIIINADLQELTYLKQLKGFKIDLNKDSKFIPYYFTDKILTVLNQQTHGSILDIVQENHYNNKEPLLDLEKIKSNTNTYIVKLSHFFQKFKYNDFKSFITQELLSNENNIRWNCFNWDMIYKILKDVISMDEDEIRSHIEQNKISLLFVLFMYCNILANKYNIVTQFNYYNLHDKILNIHFPYKNNDIVAYLTNMELIDKAIKNHRHNELIDYYKDFFQNEVKNVTVLSEFCKLLIDNTSNNLFLESEIQTKKNPIIIDSYEHNSFRISAYVVYFIFTFLRQITLYDQFQMSDSTKKYTNLLSKHVNHFEFTETKILNLNYNIYDVNDLEKNININVKVRELLQIENDKIEDAKPRKRKRVSDGNSYFVIPESYVEMYNSNFKELINKDCIGMLNLVNVNSENPVYFFLEGISSNTYKNLIDKGLYFLAVSDVIRKQIEFYNGYKLIENKNLIYITDIKVNDDVYFRFSIHVNMNVINDFLVTSEMSADEVTKYNRIHLGIKLYFLQIFKNHLNRYIINPIRSELDNFQNKDFLFLLKKNYYIFLKEMHTSFYNNNYFSDKYNQNILDGILDILIQLILYNKAGEIIENYWINSGSCMLLTLERNNNNEFVINSNIFYDDYLDLFIHYYYKLILNKKIIYKPGLDLNIGKLNNFNHLRVKGGFYKKKNHINKIIAFITVPETLYGNKFNELSYTLSFCNALETIKMLHNSKEDKELHYAFFLYFLDALLSLNLNTKNKSDISIIINTDKKELNLLKDLTFPKLLLNSNYSFTPQFGGDEQIESLINQPNICTLKIKISRKTHNHPNSLSSGIITNISNYFNFPSDKDFNSQYIKDHLNVLTKLVFLNSGDFEWDTIEWNNISKDNYQINWNSFNWDVIYNIVNNYIIMSKEDIRDYVEKDKISILYILYSFCYILASKYNIVTDFNCNYLSGWIAVDCYNTANTNNQLVFPVPILNNKESHSVLKKSEIANIIETITTYYNVLDVNQISNFTILTKIFNIMKQIQKTELDLKKLNNKERTINLTRVLCMGRDVETEGNEPLTKPAYHSLKFLMLFLNQIVNTNFKFEKLKQVCQNFDTKINMKQLNISYNILKTIESYNFNTTIPLKFSTKVPSTPLLDSVVDLPPASNDNNNNNSLQSNTPKDFMGSFGILPTPEKNNNDNDPTEKLKILLPDKDNSELYKNGSPTFNSGLSSSSSHRSPTFGDSSSDNYVNDINKGNQPPQDNNMMSSSPSSAFFHSFNPDKENKNEGDPNSY